MRETCKIELVVERNLEWAFGRQGSVILHFIDPLCCSLLGLLFGFSLFIAALHVYHELYMFHVLSPKKNLKGVQRPAAFAIVCFFFEFCTVSFSGSCAEQVADFAQSMLAFVLPLNFLF